MPNNIAVSITVDTADLVAKRAILSAELKSASKDLNDFAKTAAATGSTDALKTSMLGAATTVTTLKNEIKQVDDGLVVHTAHVGNAREAYEALRVVQAALTGDFARAGEEAARFGERLAAHEEAAKLFAAAMSPAGLAVIGLTAASIAAVAIAVEYDAAQRKLVDSTIGLGAASGVSGEQIKSLATNDLTNLSSTISENISALEAFSAAGVTNTQTLDILKSSVGDFAALTGQKAAEAVKELAKAMADPKKGAEELQEQLGLLSAAQLQEIDTLVDLGDKYQAQAVLTQALHDRTQEAAEAAGGTQTSWHDLGVAAQNAANLIASMIVQIDKFDQISGSGAPAQGSQNQIDAIQRLVQLKKDSAAALSLEQGTPEGQAQGQRDVLQGNVDKLTTALQADIQLYGAHSAAVQRDGQALSEYTRALTTYLPAQEKAHQISALDAQIAAAKHAHNQTEISDLTQKKALLEQSGVVESQAAAQTAAADAAAVARSSAGAGRKRHGPDEVSEWTATLHAEEVASGEFFQDQTAKELTFWQSKVSATTQGSKEWLDVQSKIYDAQKALAHQSYDEQLAALNDQLEADKDNWTKEQADWNAKLTFIKAHYGAESVEYQNANREFEAAEREHQRAMSEIARSAETASLNELKANLATERTIREQDARTAESQINSSAQYSPLGDVKAAQQIMAIHQQAAQQEIADDRAVYANEDSLRTQAVARALQAYGQDSQQYVQAVAEKKKADDDFYNQQKIKENQATQQQIQDLQKIQQAWHSQIDPLVSATGNQFKGLIEGTETWGQALANIGEQALTLVINAIERMAEEWIVGMITGQAAQKTTALTQVASYAGLAGAAGVASMAAAPWPLDMGAPAFGAAMSLSALSYAGLASLDVGTNSVPSDMIAQIHKGERVMPAGDNAALMAMLAGGGAGGGHTVNVGDTHVHVDGGGSDGVVAAVKQVLKDHPTKVADAVGSALRNGWRPSYKQPTGAL